MTGGGETERSGVSVGNRDICRGVCGNSAGKICGDQDVGDYFTQNDTVDAGGEQQDRDYRRAEGRRRSGRPRVGPCGVRTRLPRMDGADQVRAPPTPHPPELSLQRINPPRSRMPDALRASCAVRT